MSEWAPKRFWKEAAVIETEAGFAIALDGRPVKTPAKTALVVPTRALAHEIAREWDAQEGQIDPFTMPCTRSANAALDKVSIQHDEVAGLIAEYGNADLLCYRAEGPEGLVQRQAAAWDPLLNWADAALGARLAPVTGLMHQPQDSGAQARLAQRVEAMDNFTLTGFHDLVALSGSLVIGFAVLHDHRPPEEAWEVSRIDETWQAEQWGADEEAEEMANHKKHAFFHAKRFIDLAKPGHRPAAA